MRNGGGAGVSGARAGAKVGTSGAGTGGGGGAGGAGGGVQASNWLPVPTSDALGNPAGSLTGVGRLEADFNTSLAAGQNVDLQVRFTIIGAHIPHSNCGMMLQSYTLGGANLTRTN